MKKVTVLMSTIFFAGLSSAIDAKILNAIAHIESRNRNGVVGDLKMKEHSYGKYQIRRIYMEDVMSTNGDEFRKLFHVEQPTLKEIRYNDVMGRWFVEKYITKYGARYTKLTGKPLTPEIAFMIHNGGPMGWKKGLKVHVKAYAYSVAALKYYKEIAA